MLTHKEVLDIMIEHVDCRIADANTGSMSRAAEAIAALLQKACKWQYTEKGWRPGCKPTTGIHVAGTLAEYGILYCSHCGGKIVEGE